MIEAHYSLAFAKLCLSTGPMTAMNLLQDRVLPFCEQQGGEVERVPADNGREYCGRPLGHPCEFFWRLQTL